jgi:hypothetical protein
MVRPHRWPDSVKAWMRRLAAAHSVRMPGRCLALLACVQAGANYDSTSCKDLWNRNDLETERGITILAKCASVVWRETRINISDMPFPNTLAVGTSYTLCGRYSG